MIRTKRFFVLACLFVMLGCTDDNADGTEPQTGSLHLTGTWDQEMTPEVTFKWALFECPFTMPPSDSNVGTITDNKLDALIEDIEVGQWCFLAFIDMNPDDGLKPVEGDPQAYPPQNQQSHEVTIEAGKTTTVNLSFEIR